MTAFVQKAAQRALSILRSKQFFWFVVILLAGQALWIALVAVYPMAFDENYHLGIIQVYAQQWSPFITTTPPDSGTLGDLIRTPSYLFHYLMSFPYRLISLFTSQEMIQIIFLRCINIALFAAGLVAFRRLFLLLRISPAIINFSLLMLVLIPVVPFLAGQINYDNLLFLLVPLIALATLRCTRSLRERQVLPATHFTALIATGVAGSLTKYAFLPIFLAAGMYLVWVFIKQRQSQAILQNTWTSFRRLSAISKVTIAVILLLAGGLFIERYGVNLVEYGSLEPKCSEVQSIEHCMQYGPWARNYAIQQNNTAASDVPYDPALPLFLPEWVGGMMHRLYFAINYDYVNYYELPIPIIVAYIVGSIGLLLCLVFWRVLFKNRELYLLVLITAIYVGSVLYVNFSGFLNFKTMLAINGRYLILILPFVFVLFALAYSIFLRKISLKRTRSYQLGLAAVVLLLTLQGGGILTFAVRSDSDWYWQTPLAQNLGDGLKEAATPFIVGAGHREQP
jgi:hypothetical protein